MPRSNLPPVEKSKIPTFSTRSTTNQASVSINHSFRWWIGLTLLFAVVVRLAAIYGDLAIDEVWTLWFVQNVTHRLIDIIALRHDNNHLLNTMIMYCLGPNLPGLCYRIPAVVASIATVWLAKKISTRNGGTSSGLTTSVLVGASYLLILYGTEARGYAYVVFFAYLSWLYLQKLEQSEGRVDAIIFALSCSLGFLAHLTFLYCYAGFVLWTIWKCVGKPSRMLVVAQILPMMMAVLLYLFFIRGMGIGGGDETQLFGAILSTLSVAVGGPTAGDLSLIAAVLTTVLMLVAFFQLWQTDRATAACFFTIIVLAPTCVLMATGHDLVYPRYFLIPVAFALLMFGDLGERSGKRGSSFRYVQAGIIGLYLVGNVWWTVRLFDHGRGDYSHAMAWMAEQGRDRSETVSSDHDFRNALLFGYYSHRLWGDDVKLRYVTQQGLPQTGTDWAIVHDFEGDPPIQEMQEDRFGNKYQFKRVFRHHSLTGWNWWIYHRIERSK